MVLGSVVHDWSLYRALLGVRKSGLLWFNWKYTEYSGANKLDVDQDARSCSLSSFIHDILSHNIVNDRVHAPAPAHSLQWQAKLRTPCAARIFMKIV